MELRLQAFTHSRLCGCGKIIVAKILGIEIVAEAQNDRKRFVVFNL